MSGYPIPDEALNSHTGILGKTGSGKTFTAKGLVERLLGMRRQVVIVDPTGAWYGLRTGFDIPIFGGRHGDLEINDKAGAAVAGVIVEQGTSTIVDLSLMSGAAQRRFMTAFAHQLRQKPPGALWLVLDEADEFLPQQLQPEMMNLFGDLKWMVRRGRLNGFRVMMITQRPAEIAKAVLTQIETLVAHRLTAPQDRKAIEEWVKGHHDPSEAKEVLSSLAGLEQGVAWVWAPDLDILAKEKMPAIATFDSSRTPDPGEGAVQVPALASLDMSAIRAAMKPADGGPAKQVKHEESVCDSAQVADLRGRIAELEAQLVAANERDRRSFEDGKRAGISIGITRAREAINALRIDEPASPVGDQGGKRDVKSSAARAPLDPGAPEARPAERAESSATRRRSPPTSKPEVPQAAKAAVASASSKELGAPHQRVLNALAWWAAAGFPEIDRRRACIMAGYSPKASTFGVYISELTREGLVEVPAPAQLRLTAAGEARAEAPSTDSLLDRARALLSPAEVKAFDAILAAYPNEISRGELADTVGLSRTASTLGVYLSKISSFGFLEVGRGTVRLVPWLVEKRRSR